MKRYLEVIELRSNMKQWNFKMKTRSYAQTLKTLPWLWTQPTNSQCINEKLLRKKLFVLCSYNILSTNIDIVKIFFVLHSKVALLTKRCSEFGTRSRHQRIFRKVLPNHIHIENIDQKINLYDSGETEIRVRVRVRVVFGSILSWVRGDVKSFICVVKLKSHATTPQI